MDAESGRRYADRYPDFRALAAKEAEGTDYRISVVERKRSRVAVIAPHGGSIERRTSAIARAIAGDDFKLYLFEGLDESGSYEVLHITSHRFDEPRCLRLLEPCSHVLAVHGCGGDEDLVMLGGLDRELITQIAAALEPLDVGVSTDRHPYPGTHERNICNRGKERRGVQIELSDALRGSPRELGVVAAIRGVLAGADAASHAG
ncbi:MAG TPA: poly-gamma-glutamate hydrolase family protein [Gammaproteobacteria bacterium]|jgi:phage replication-related protein YjqB (UPF0714/DUF867 family)|nr:poly-gamma-glutamate hydrolase family protein [Gammaproteobacteria bacterium]